MMTGNRIWLVVRTEVTGEERIKKPWVSVTTEDVHVLLLSITTVNACDLKSFMTMVSDRVWNVSFIALKRCWDRYHLVKEDLVVQHFKVMRLEGNWEQVVIIRMFSGSRA